MSAIAPLWISLRIALCATAVVFVAGVLLARIFLYSSGWVKLLTDLIFTLPLVLPPTVVGFFLLVLCGRGGVIGRLLEPLNLSLVFTWQGAVVAAAVVSFPLIYRAAKGAFEQVDGTLIWAARTLGMNEAEIFFRVLLPQAWPGVAAGVVLAFARALGEFGATLMIAGNIPGRTQTIPIAIYFATAGGDMKTAWLWVAVITAVSCLSLGLMQFYSSRRVSGGIGSR